ncbi:MAG: DUF1559 domain-containing protein [Armatimonadota bacterium]|nr:DUF1559 domain-containing protein [Armatimonadota bacterium]
MQSSHRLRQSQPRLNQRERAAVRSGFTLIELLVVIAIISILASMLFPTFSRAREQARKTVCISNLRQVGLGIMQYNQDWDERFPIGNPFWDMLSPGNPRTPQLATVVDPYVKSLQVWACPSWSGVYSPNYFGNYSFITEPVNNVIGVPGLNPGDPPSRDAYAIAALGQPAEYPLLFCGVAPQQANPSAINAHTGVSDATWDAGNALGGTAVLFGDSHSKYIVFDRGRWDSFYSSPRR